MCQCDSVGEGETVMTVLYLRGWCVCSAWDVVFTKDATAIVLTFKSLICKLHLRCASASCESHHGEGVGFFVTMGLLWSET